MDTKLAFSAKILKSGVIATTREYRLVSDIMPKRFQETINDLIRAGWQPLGSVVVIPKQRDELDDQLYQTMVLHMEGTTLEDKITELVEQIDTLNNRVYDLGDKITSLDETIDKK